jgi:hypothetical protein
MPRASRKNARQRILWTVAEIKQLRSAARRRPVSLIARELGRSEAAVRFKATTLKISLALKGR